MRRTVQGFALVAPLVVAGLAAAAPLGAQRLTLRDALERAATAFPTRMAQGHLATAEGQLLSASQFNQPRLQFEGSYLRTTDPLTAFGFALRQRELTPLSFDPARLNHPEARGNLATGVLLELPLVNIDARRGVAAARSGALAAAASGEWARTSVEYEVTIAYYTSLLANDRVKTLEAALTAAQANVRAAAAMFRNGSVTRSDALLAEVKAGEIEAVLVGARAETSLARAQLALTMGSPYDTAWTLPATVPDSALLAALVSTASQLPDAIDTRADLKAARQGSTAAEMEASRAKGSALPHLNSFGRVDWNTADTPFGGSSSWTVGVMASWAIQRGGVAAGAVQAAEGRVAVASAGNDALLAQARLEVQRANAAVQVAAARLAIAERGVAQSSEAHRIVSRKYEGGLATVVELLDAAAAETQSRLTLADARYQVIISVATRLRATGNALTPLTAIDS